MFTKSVIPWRNAQEKWKNVDKIKVKCYNII